MAVKDVIINFTTKDKDITGTKNKFDDLNSSAKKSAGSVKDLENQIKSSFSNMTKGLVKLGGALAGAFAIKQVVMNAVNIFKDFEAANSKLQSVLGATTSEMKRLSDQAKELGSSTSFTASQVTELQTEFAKLGFPTKEILNMTESTLAAAAAMGSGLGEQAALTGATIKAFGLASTDAARVNDVLAKSTSRSALDFSKLSTSMSTIAPVASNLGFGLEDTVALLGNLSDSGFDASTAATATRNIMLKLADSSSVLGKRLKEPVRDLPSLIRGLKQLTNDGVDLSEALELTDVRSVAAFSTFLSGTESLEKLSAELNNAEGAAKKMADTMLDNLAGDITKAESAWEGFILSIESGDGRIARAMRNIVQSFTQLLDNFKLDDRADELGLTRALFQDFDEGQKSVFNLDNALKKFRKGLAETNAPAKSYRIAMKSINEQMKTLDRSTELGNARYIVLRENLIALGQEMDVSTNEFKENSGAVDENTESLEKNSDSLKKQLSFLDRLANYVKETKKKIEDEEIMSTIFGDDAAEEDFMADIVAAGDKEIEYLNEKNRNILDADKELNDALKEQRDDAFNEMIEQRAEHDEIEAQLNEEKYALFLQTTQMFTDQLGNTFAAAMMNNEEMAKASSKAMVLTLLDAVERVVLLSIAQTQALALASPESVATLGAAGLAKGVIMTALIKGVFGAIKAQITQNFRDGVIDLAGAGTSQSDSIPANLSAGESVMTSKETKEHKPLLLAIRNNKLDDYLQKEYLPQFYMGKLPTKKANKKSGAYSDFSELIKLQKRGTKITNHKQISKPILDAITEANFVNRNGW